MPPRPGPRTAAGGPQPRSAPFSVHARGVPLFDGSRFWDLPRHVARLLLDLRDISSSIGWWLACQTWLSFWSALIAMLSVIFFTYYKGNKLAMDLDWTLPSFAVVLPLTGFLWVAYLRRERCLDLLSEARVLMLGIYAAHRDWLPAEQQQQQQQLPGSNGDAVWPGSGASSSNGELESVRGALASIIGALKAYLMPSRFYSRYFPAFGFRAAMVQIALERAGHQRTIRAGLASLGQAAAALRGAGLPPALEAALHERCLRLGIALDRLGNVKEFRTPLAVRSLARFYVCFVIPLFFGPYWAWVSLGTNFGFAFFFTIVFQLALTGVLNAGLALEDPFDNSGIDGIFVPEALYDVEEFIGVAPGSTGGTGTVERGSGRAGGGAVVGPSPAPPPPLAPALKQDGGAGNGAAEELRASTGGGEGGVNASPSKVRLTVPSSDEAV